MACLPSLVVHVLGGTPLLPGCPYTGYAARRHNKYRGVIIEVERSRERQREREGGREGEREKERDKDREV